MITFRRLSPAAAEARAEAYTLTIFREQQTEAALRQALAGALARRGTPEADVYLIPQSLLMLTLKRLLSGWLFNFELVDILSREGSDELAAELLRGL